MENLQDRDEQLWQIKTKAAIKSHMILYLLVNAGLWGVWFLADSEKHHRLPWPVWPSLTWGIILAYRYYNGLHKVTPGKFGKLEKREQTRY
ncbi:MAG: 2TM domain-containing protein [Chitinophaga sp.]|uniref:2TM domain-containing protein n=1 Tax=Chitinophaga sp. TaxID=1869181 RepID=UPI0025B7BE93|nr:2TM domain-containing protein [Chitinophaga sp.]MBV8254301.1 2TM domain-containing protein [Chitinophaga sp.]